MARRETPFSLTLTRIIGMRHTLLLPGIDADMREFGELGIRNHERQLQEGVIAESSQNPTLSENQSAISVLHKPSFAQQFGLWLKTLAFLVAKTCCEIEMNGNRFVHPPLA